MNAQDRADLITHLRTEPSDAAAVMILEHLLSTMPSDDWIKTNVVRGERSYSNSKSAREPVVYLVST